MLIALGAGLAVGLFHVLSGPDHLGAIAPMASIERQRVWAIGLRWGLGHTLGLVLVAAAAAFVTHMAFVDSMSAASERFVGLMLLAIAGWGFWRCYRATIAKEINTNQNSHSHKKCFAPYAIGVLHGCAGGSHVVAIFLALAFPTVAGVMTYLVGFVAGSILAMTAFAAGLGYVTGHRGMTPRLQHGFMLFSSSISAVIGTWWLVVPH